MIDPKLNEIPVDTEPLTEEERQARIRATPARGLSINDTIAHDANLSIGGRGVDTSGVSAGAGSGADSTGTTPLADAPLGKTSTDRTKFDK